MENEEAPGQQGPQDPDSTTITVQELVPILNAARNAYHAAIMTGMSIFEACMIETKTYEIFLKMALGLPL